MNYYGVNQWDISKSNDEPLAMDDPRRRPLRELVARVWDRYGGDLLITETAHNDDLRPWWLKYVADEAQATLAAGIPLRGVCLYPIRGMPEWHEPDRWAMMGLWDCRADGGRLTRHLCVPMFEALRNVQNVGQFKQQNRRDP